MSTNDFVPGDQVDDNEVICPHCGGSWQPEAGDFDEHEEECECYKCGRVFMARAEFSVSYHTRAVPPRNQEGAS